MRVEISSAAARLVRELAGRLWVWASARDCAAGGHRRTCTQPPTGHRACPGSAWCHRPGRTRWKSGFALPPVGFPTCWRSACAADAGRGSRPTGMAAGSRSDAVKSPVLPQ